jgi:electron transport complex protein RnfG
MTQRSEHTAVSGQLQPSSTSPALTLALFAGVCAALVTTVHLFTSETIAIAKSAYSLKQVRAVLEAGASPALHELANQDWRESDLIDSSRTIYSADSRLFAISGFSSDGYSGRIEIVTGIDLSAQNGTASVIAVRVTAHRETPGIGDRITSTTWLDQLQESWQKTKPQRVDALSGATISATAVTDAVTRTVAFAELNASALLQQNLTSETAR